MAVSRGFATDTAKFCPDVAGRVFTPTQLFVLDCPRGPRLLTRTEVRGLRDNLTF